MRNSKVVLVILITGLCLSACKNDPETDAVNATETATAEKTTAATQSKPRIKPRTKPISKPEPYDPVTAQAATEEPVLVNLDNLSNSDDPEYIMSVALFAQDSSAFKENLSALQEILPRQDYEYLHSAVARLEFYSPYRDKDEFYRSLDGKSAKNIIEMAKKRR